MTLAAEAPAACEGRAFERDERNRDRGSFRAASEARRGRARGSIHCAGAGGTMRDQRAAAALVDWRFVFPFSRRPLEHAATFPRFWQLRRPDDRSGHMGALRQHRRNDRRQRFDSTGSWRAVGFLVPKAISGPPPGDDVGPCADVAFHGRGRHVLQPVLRSDVRHRQRVGQALHRRAVCSVGNAFLGDGEPHCRRRLDVVAIRHAVAARRPRQRSLLSDRSGRNRPRIPVAAVLDSDFPGGSRRAAARAAVQDHRVVQHVRSHIHDHQRRARRLDGKRLDRNIRHRLCSVRNRTSVGARQSQRLRRDRTDPHLFSGDPAAQGGGVTMQDEETAVMGRPAGLGRTLIAVAVGLVYFSPVIWMILASFKTRPDALATPPKLIFTPTLEHFWASFHRVSADGARVMDTGLVRNFANSIAISLISVGLALALGTLAAYGFARLRVVGRDYFMFYILVLRMVPPITAIIPLYFLFRVTGLGGSYIAIILVYTAFNLPFAIWMLRSFIDELHQPIEEAARLDGSSELRILWRICLPQMQAGIAATAIIAFVFTWNDFLFSLLLTSVDTRTVPVAMTRVVGADVGVDWGVFAAIGTIYLVPILLVAFFLQSQLLRGATFGTVPR